MGFGVCLINMRVFDMLQIEADKTDGNFLPLFKFEETPNKIGMVGEDVFFFRKVKAAGGKCFIDHRLSWEVGHLHEQILTNAHAVMQRDRWVEHNKTKSPRLQQRLEELDAEAAE